MNARLQNAPGLMGPPDDDFSDVRWQYAVDECAASMVKADEVGELVGLIGDPSVGSLLCAITQGWHLSYANRQTLVLLERCHRATHERLTAEYERREEE